MIFTAAAVKCRPEQTTLRLGGKETEVHNAFMPQNIQYKASFLIVAPG